MSTHRALTFLCPMLCIFAAGLCLCGGACITVPKKAAVVEPPATQPYVLANIGPLTTQPVVDADTQASADVKADVKAGVQLGGKQVHAGGDVTINEGIPWKWVLAVLAAWHVPSPKYRKLIPKRREPLRSAIV